MQDIYLIKSLTTGDCVQFRGNVEFATEKWIDDNSITPFYSRTQVSAEGEVQMALFSEGVHTQLPCRVILNDNAAILFTDHGKTVVKRCKDDKPDKRRAFLEAYFQTYSGLSKTRANKYLEELERKNNV